MAYTVVYIFCTHEGVNNPSSQRWKLYKTNVGLTMVTSLSIGFTIVMFTVVLAYYCYNIDTHINHRICCQLYHNGTSNNWLYLQSVTNNKSDNKYRCNFMYYYLALVPYLAVCCFWCWFYILPSSQQPLPPHHQACPYCLWEGQSLQIYQGERL